MMLLKGCFDHKVSLVVKIHIYIYLKLFGQLHYKTKYEASDF